MRNTCTVEGAKLRSRRLAPTKTLLAASRFDWKTERQTRRLCLTDVNPMNVSCKHKEYDACFQAGRHRHSIGLRNANKINPSTNIWCVIESGNVRRLFFVSTFDCFSFYSCLFWSNFKAETTQDGIQFSTFFFARKLARKFWTLKQTRLETLWTERCNFFKWKKWAKFSAYWDLKWKLLKARKLCVEKKRGNAHNPV